MYIILSWRFHRSPGLSWRARGGMPWIAELNLVLKLKRFLTVDPRTLEFDPNRLARVGDANLMNGCTAWLDAAHQVLGWILRDVGTRFKIFTCSNTRVFLYYLICSCFHETIEMHDNCDLHDQDAIDSYNHSDMMQTPTTKFQLDPKS